MTCPKCNGTATDVIHSRTTEKAVRRRRQCCACSYRFTTYERVERPRLMVVKKMWREPFARDKLLTGIERACEKRDVSKADIEGMVDAIECAIFDKNELELTTEEIGGMVMRNLASRDQVAYVRFASVYREFTDIESFATVVEMLNKDKI